MASILVADDDGDTRRMLAAVFGSAGHLVYTAGNGTELLDRFRTLMQSERPPAVVVSDVHMPGCDGLQVLEQIHEAMPALPVVLITAFGDPRTHARARELGAVAVLDKPFPIESLRQTVLAQLEVA